MSPFFPVCCVKTEIGTRSQQPSPCRMQRRENLHQDLCETKENIGRVCNGFGWTFPNTETVMVELFYWMQVQYLVGFKC